MPFPSLTWNDLLPPNVRQELDQFTSLIEGYLRSQHKDSGAHSDVTADSVASTDGYTEHDRTVALGDWTLIPFAASRFTASGGQTWTLTSGDQTRLAYTLVGHTCTVSFVLVTTSVSGACVTLSIALPTGLVAKTANVGTFACSDNGTTGFGVVSVAALGTALLLTKDVAGTFTWTAAANTSTFSGTFSFEVS